MGRFKASGESQATLAAGNPSGTTFNGFFASITAGAASNYKLRRVVVGVRAGATIPISQQITINIHRVTVRIVGTGFTTIVGQNMDPRGPASAIAGLDLTTATVAGTTGPTIGANPIGKLTFNSQSAYDFPWEGPEEMFCDQGLANGIGFVNIGNPLPTAHFYTIDFEWEE